MCMNMSGLPSRTSIEVGWKLHIPSGSFALAFLRYHPKLFWRCLCSMVGLGPRSKRAWSSPCGSWNAHMRATPKQNVLPSLHFLPNQDVHKTVLHRARMSKSALVLQSGWAPRHRFPSACQHLFRCLTQSDVCCNSVPVLTKWPSPESTTVSSSKLIFRPGEGPEARLRRTADTPAHSQAARRAAPPRAMDCTRAGGPRAPAATGGTKWRAAAPLGTDFLASGRSYI
mmetsp:Transcript_76480/g.212428  ORF Transcript_76480/g.212428 Transcript_76480/m.212428 type:complete len:227 (-) Transcript_76480:21-701(-)